MGSVTWVVATESLAEKEPIIRVGSFFIYYVDLSLILTNQRSHNYLCFQV